MAGVFWEDVQPLPLPRVFDFDPIAVVLVPPCNEGADEFPLGESRFVFNKKVGVVLGKPLSFFSVLFFSVHFHFVAAGLSLARLVLFLFSPESGLD